MKKRGQAAIEYLTTYGWAIIVLIIMVSSLSLFGVINPRSWAPDRCELGAEFHCVDHVFENYPGNNVTLKLLLRNNLRERVSISGINCTFEDDTKRVFNYNVSIGSEETKELTCYTNDNNVMSMDGKIRAKFTFSYKKRDGIFPHEIDGNAFSQVVIK